MSTKGRKPKPHHLKVIEGNPGKRAMLDAPLQVEPVQLPAPDHLDDHAKALWSVLMPELVKLNLFTKLDVVALEQYCHAYGQWRRAVDKLKEHGADTYETHGRNGKMFRVRPEVTIASEAVRVGRSIGSEFGLSPVARLRLGNIGQGELFDPFAEWMRANAS